MEKYKRTNDQGSALTVVGGSSWVLCCGDMGGRAEHKSFYKKLDLNRKKEKINQGNGPGTSQTQASKHQSSNSPPRLRQLKLQRWEPLQIAIVGGGVNAWANRLADSRHLLTFPDWNPNSQLQIHGNVWIIP